LRTWLIHNYTGSSDPYKTNVEFHVIIKQQQQSAQTLNSLTGNNINYNDNILLALSVSLPTSYDWTPLSKNDNGFDSKLKPRENKSSEGDDATSQAVCR
jgi:hypothetical protein